MGAALKSKKKKEHQNKLGEAKKKKKKKKKNLKMVINYLSFKWIVIFLSYSNDFLEIYPLQKIDIIEDKMFLINLLPRGNVNLFLSFSYTHPHTRTHIL